MKISHRAEAQLLRVFRLKRFNDFDQRRVVVVVVVVVVIVVGVGVVLKCFDNF